MKALPSLLTNRMGPVLCAPLVFSLATCGSPAPDDTVPPMPAPCAAAGITHESRFPAGSPDGHPDPFSPSVRSQARATRVRDASYIAQPDNARQPVRPGDYLLINDRIAVYIEAPGLSDGYQGLGGDILAIEPVGTDGRPSGVSQYGETLVTFSRQGVGPDSVSVLNDGRDGKAAIVRVSGTVRDIPFLETFAGILSDHYDLPVALDYVLEPGAERVTLRLSLMNPENAPVDFGGNQLVGFFQSSRNVRFTPERGFAEPQERAAWVGFDNAAHSFAFRMRGGALGYLISRSGFEAYRAPGMTLGACENKSVDFAEWIVAGPGIDSLRAAIRRVDGDTSWRAVSGIVRDSSGQPLPGARVHAVDGSGKYLTRADSDARGAYTLHVPPGAIDLIVTQDAHTMTAPRRITVTAGGDPMTADLALPQAGTLIVRARDAGSMRALPVRIQAIPQNPPPAIPATFGVPQPRNARSLLAWSATGEGRFALPPGPHRVVISHGPEWDIYDASQTIAAGKDVTVAADLLHSVDSTGVMCADFHIHSYYSADSSDPVPLKVTSAVADGLDIPVSSEHEWIIDFQPVVRDLGLAGWAFGMSSQELTTFSWGHFGVVPINARPDQVNRGAIPWLGKRPAEVFHDVHAQPESPVLIVNHPRSASIGGYFSAADFQRTTLTGDPELWSDDFDAVEAFNDSDFDSNRQKIVADWFALLNAGKRIWAVGSSDSHAIASSPVGYPRTCLRFGHDDPGRLTPGAVRDAVRAGQATISGGLYMTVETPGGIGPGGHIPSAGDSVDFRIVVQAPTWLAARQLEVIVNGETERTLELQEVVAPAGHRYEAAITLTRPKKPQNWVVFHARGPAGRDLSPIYPGRLPFAVSNPVFF